MNYFPFHIGDYASATRHLSWEEDLAYRRLLDLYYTNEGPLPLELRAVCRLVLATTDAQREAVAIVLEEFFEKTEEGWVNRRGDAEIDTMRIQRQKQRDKANKRWHQPEPAPGNAAASKPDATADAAAQKPDAGAMPPVPVPVPVPNKEKPRSSRKTPLPQDFGISDRVRTWAEGKGLNHLDHQLEAFLSYVKRNGRQYVDWDEALMTAIRDDWAKARGKPAPEDRFKGAL